MKILFLLVASAGLVLASSPQQLEFLNAITRGDIKKVVAMIGISSFEVQGNAGQAPKRRRLEPIDPSFSDNLAVFTAISVKQRKILNLLLADQRVQNSISHFDLTLKCIERGYNDLVKPYLFSPVQVDFTPFFSRAAIYNNLEVLAILAPDCRVNLDIGMVESLTLMTPYEEIDDVFMFFLENAETQNIDYDKSLMLQLACAKKSMRILLKLFSLPYEVLPNLEYLRELLKQKEYEVPTLQLVRNLEHAEREFKSLVYFLTRPLKWFSQLPKGQFEASKSVIESYSPVVQNAFLALACSSLDTEKLKFLLSLNLKLSEEMVTMLFAASTNFESIDIFSVLISTPSTLRCLSEQSLNSLTEWAIKEDYIMAQMYMIHIVSRILEPFSLINCGLNDLYGNIEGLEVNLAKLNETVDELQREGLKGLAAICRHALTHHTAMMTIYSQGVYLPNEIRSLIFDKNLDSLSLHYQT